ncbi:2-hydroxychromene-2-carboxylate isomerase [Stella humosa]|uniref:2-hydroxychromene-2-carboxylate isomerase n=2 Tax=Stella humosa TaxID=94 RepID=A0A3N1KJM5_9PROT|nr:2-hydroxychromene-2-carboxylate isomerase [Stella humosa]
MIIDYYMSHNSPWAYLGSRRFADIAARAGATVQVRPVDFGRIFPQSGGLPLPKRAPQRQAYRLVELGRWSSHLGVPLTLHPKAFPSPEGARVGMVLALRESAGDAAAMRLSHGFMAALWADDADVNDPAVLDQVASRLGFDGPALRARGQEPAIAALFEADTERAIAAGVFGAPSYVVDGEIFWGQDRLEFLARRLGA